VTVTGRVVEVTPNVTGQIVAIQDQCTVEGKRRAISDRPGAVSVQGLAVAGVARGGEAAGRDPEIELRTGNSKCKRAHHAGRVQQTRNADIQKLAEEGANTQFKAQDNQNQYGTALAQLNAARAAQQSAKLAMDSEIGGVNTTVAQLSAQLEYATWELSQTAVRAPADGYVTLVTLSVGDRALQARSAMSFIVENEITLVGMFSQNGFHAIKEGANVEGRQLRANNGHSDKPTKRLSLYVTSEQATRSSHSASTAITNEMFAKDPTTLASADGELRLARIPPLATLFSMTAVPPAPSA
jgi:multidrug efflux pump subunit AcrA (membrane-fusion protein)